MALIACAGVVLWSAAALGAAAALSFDDDDQTSRTPAGPASPDAAPTTPTPPPALPPTNLPGVMSPARDPSAPVSAPALPPGLDAQPDVRYASVLLRDGRTFSGELMDESEAGCTLKIAGIETRFESAHIERVQYVEGVRQQYRRLRLAIPDADSEGLLKLAEWLTNKGELDLARFEVAGVLKRDPVNTKAAKAKTDLDRLIDLRDKARRAQDGAPPEDEEMSPVEPEGTRPPPARVPTLTPEQINLIKVYELDLRSPPTIIIARTVMERMLEAKQGHPLAPTTREAREAILRAPAAQQLDLMFRMRAREFYPQVKVQGSPEVMRRFADDVVRSWVINACATSECHGGLEAGRLVLATRKPGSDPTVYTNFYILDRFRTSDNRPLINWDEPDRSLLLQLGLPRDISSFRHPVVPFEGTGGPAVGDAWRPSFRSSSDRRYQQVVAWIKSMYRPRPDSGLEYQPLRPFEPPAPRAKGEDVER